MTYTRRLTWPTTVPDSAEDWEILQGGTHIGRIHLRQPSEDRPLWKWSVYMTDGIEAGPEVPIMGEAESFEAAHEALTKSYEVLKRYKL